MSTTVLYRQSEKWFNQEKHQTDQNKLILTICTNSLSPVWPKSITNCAKHRQPDKDLYLIHKAAIETLN